jgi:hypothetical protein
MSFFDSGRPDIVALLSRITLRSAPFSYASINSLEVLKVGRNLNQPAGALPAQPVLDAKPPHHCSPHRRLQPFFPKMSLSAALSQHGFNFRQKVPFCQMFWKSANPPLGEAVASSASSNQ